MKLETYEKAKELQEGIESLEKILGFAETKGTDTVQVHFGGTTTHLKGDTAKGLLVEKLKQIKEELKYEFDKLEEPKKELQVGDVVTIRSDLVVGKKYGRVGVCLDMQAYFGKNTKVKCIRANGTYALDIDSSFWEWSKQMFEGYENE